MNSSGQLKRFTNTTFIVETAEAASGSQATWRSRIQGEAPAEPDSALRCVCKKNRGGKKKRGKKPS